MWQLPTKLSVNFSIFPFGHSLGIFLWVKELMVTVIWLKKERHLKLVIHQVWKPGQQCHDHQQLIQNVSFRVPSHTC